MKKSKLINFCRNKNLNKVLTFFMWLFIIIFIIGGLNNISKYILRLLLLFSMIIFLFKSCIMDTLSREKDDFLEKNKLYMIILSNYHFWYLILCVAFLPIFFSIILLFTNMYFIFEVILLVILYIVIDYISKIIAKVFRKKLIY